MMYNINIHTEKAFMAKPSYVIKDLNFKKDCSTFKLELSIIDNNLSFLELLSSVISESINWFNRIGTFRNQSDEPYYINSPNTAQVKKLGDICAKINSLDLHKNLAKMPQVSLDADCINNFLNEVVNVHKRCLQPGQNLDIFVDVCDFDLLELLQEQSPLDHPSEFLNDYKLIKNSIKKILPLINKILDYKNKASFNVSRNDLRSFKEFVDNDKTNNFHHKFIDEITSDFKTSCDLFIVKSESIMDKEDQNLISK